MPRTVSVKLQADVAEYRRNIKGAEQDTRGLIRSLGDANRAGELTAVTDAAAGLGLGLLGAAGAAVKMAADFDKQMSAVQAATHATSGDMERLRQAALDAGADTKYSATEAAKGIEELSKAGISTADVLAGGLKGALDLASAGTLDVGEAAETAASAMNQFGLKGKDVPHIADLLAAAAGKAQGSVHDMGMALNQAGLVSNQMGVSIEETTGTLAAFASAGLLGSDAGTSLKTAMLMLANPTEKSSDLMAEMGINAYDAGGNFVGMANLAGQLKTRLGGLTQEQRNSTLATIFGSDAIRAASVLYEQGAEGITDWTKKVNDQGYAAETAKIKTDNLAGDIERLTGSLQTLAIESGGGANEGLRLLAQGANAVVDAFAALPTPIGGTLTVLAGVSGVALLAATGWLKMRRAGADVRAELEAIGPAGERAARGMSAAAGAAGKAVAVFAALQVAGEIVSAAQKDLNPQVEALAVGLQRFAETGQLAGESSRLLGGDMNHLKDSFKFLADEDNSRRQAVKNLQGALESLVPGLEGTDESLTRTKERIGAVDQALAGMVNSGNTQAANQAFTKLAKELATGGVSMEEFKKQFPGYAAALETAAAATAGAAGKTDGLGAALDGAQTDQKEFESAAEATTAALKGQRSALVDLAERMRAEADPVFGLMDAQQKLREATKGAADATKKHGRNSDEAREASRKLALAALDLQGRAGGLAKTFDGKMTPALEATFRAAGLTESQIKDVKREFDAAKKAADKYDGKYKAAVELTGFDGPNGAAAKLNRLSAYQQALKAGKIPAGFQGPVKGADGKYYAAGGWTGPGGKWDEAGVVHADEFVVQKESRTRFERQHPGALDYLNQHGELPGYADGGRVRWPFNTTAAMTRIPSRSEVAGAVTFDFGSGGGSVSDQIVRAARALVPGVRVISKDRPGSTTLSGNTSYHARRRAVDFEPSRELARLWDARYRAQTKELISPYQQYNVHNGRRHAYTGAVWSQHNFAGGNAHDHIAMANGGVINEPVSGVGASGRSYSFGERGPETVVPGNLQRWMTAPPVPQVTVVVQGGGDGAEQTAVLRRILAATEQVGPHVARAFTSGSAQALQVARTMGGAR